MTPVIKKLVSNLYKTKILLEHDLFTKKIIERNIRKVTNYASGIVIDIGCGKKPYQQYFNKIGKYWGIDIPKRNEAVNRKVWMPEHIRMELDLIKDDNLPDIYASAVNLPIKDNSINTVLATEVLEHIPSSTDFLKELKRILTPGGNIIMTTPFCWFIHEAPHDYKRYTKWGLKKQIEINGFKTIKLIPYGNTLFTIGALIGELIYKTFGMNILMNIPVSILSIINHGIFAWLGILFRNEELPFGHLLIAKKL